MSNCSAGPSHTPSPPLPWDSWGCYSFLACYQSVVPSMSLLTADLDGTCRNWVASIVALQNSAEGTILDPWLLIISSACSTNWMAHCRKKWFLEKCTVCWYETGFYVQSVLSVSLTHGCVKDIRVSCVDDGKPKKWLLEVNNNEFILSWKVNLNWQVRKCVSHRILRDLICQSTHSEVACLVSSEVSVAMY